MPSNYINLYLPFLVFVCLLIPDIFSICDLDTHPINRIGVCPDAVAFAAG